MTAVNRTTGDMQNYRYTKSTDFVNHPICIFKCKRPAVLQDGEGK